MKSDWRKWFALPPKQKWLWLQAACVLSVIGLGLRVLPFGTFRGLYQRALQYRQHKTSSSKGYSDVVWAVQSAATRLPMNLLCLPQALATHYLIAPTPTSKIVIGLYKAPSNAFEFHAWVEVAGKTIIGDHPHSFQPMWVWE